MGPEPIALVARGASRIGQQVCAQLAQTGYDVALSFDQDEEGAQRAAEMVDQAGRSPLVLGGRIADTMVARQLVRRTRREMGVPRVLVVGPRRGPIAEGRAGDEPAGEAFLATGLAEVEPVLQADLKGPISLLQAFARAWRDHGDPDEQARIVLVPPGAALRSGPVGGPARAAKAGLVELARTAADALAPVASVNVVVPGLLEPIELEAPSVDLDALGIDVDDLASAESGEADRWVAPKAVAETVMHLIEAPKRLTGQVITVDRGLGDDVLARRPFARGESDEEAEGLPGIEQRVEPPDPDERIDLE